MTSPGSRVGPYTGRSRRVWLPALALALLWAAALSACGSSSSSGIQGASEVSAQAVNTSGRNPFMPSVGKDRQGLKQPAGASSSGAGPATYVANTPGLYGGTRNISSCDPNQMVSYLQQNPAKSYAWASALSIRTNQISSYVSKLTGVLLRTDTRVTNHGYVNGQANGFQAVLEAGTAVLVDQYGRPVVKCYCGNPLTPYTALSSPVYSGPTWAGFSTNSITIIQQSVTIIQKFTLYDPGTGMTFQRTAGQGGTDGPYQQAPPSAVNPKPGASPSGSGTPSPSGGASQNPSVSLSPNPVTQGSTETVSASGFAPNKSLDITVQRPDGVTEHYSMSSDSSGNGTYSFGNAAGAAPLGTYNVTVTDTSTGANASGSVTVVPSGGGGSGGSPQTPANTTT